jgi:hypothetical protein
MMLGGDHAMSCLAARIGLAVVVLGMVAGTASPSRGDLIVDQSDTDPILSTDFLGGGSTTILGQSFTPNGGKLSFITLSMNADYGSSSIPNIHVDLYANTGLAADPSATALATSEAVTVPYIGNGAATTSTTVTFDFATPVALTPGSTYSFFVVNPSSNASNAYVAIGNTFTNGYSGGSGFFYNGSARPDFYFAEGSASDPSVAPEPSTLVSAGLGTFMMLAVAWRRSRARVVA